MNKHFARESVSSSGRVKIGGKVFITPCRFERCPDKADYRQYVGEQVEALHFKSIKKIPMYKKVLVIIVGILLSAMTIKLIYTANLITFLTASPFIILSYIALVCMWVLDD
nr:hypothetical protein [uncultured Neisseria sp.]